MKVTFGEPRVDYDEVICHCPNCETPYTIKGVMMRLPSSTRQPGYEIGISRYQKCKKCKNSFTITMRLVLEAGTRGH